MPVVAGLPFGHIPINATLPVGVCATLGNVDAFAKEPFAHLENCLKGAAEGLRELRGMEKSIQRFTRRQLDARTLGEIYGVIFDQYAEQVGHACYAEMVRSQLPARLDAAETQISQAEWMRAAENSHVMFDLADTVFVDSTGIGMLIRLRRRARELGWQFFLIAPRPQVMAALKMMKLDEFFTIQASLSGARLIMETAVGAAAVTSGIQETELQIRWNGEVTALNAVELGAYTESELAQVTPGMTVVLSTKLGSTICSSALANRSSRPINRLSMV